MSSAATHSAHRPATDSGRAVHPGGNGHPPRLAIEDLLPRVAGARKSFWTPERDAILERLWSQADPYMTSNAIAAGFGLTKNAIVGRARRMGLPQRSKLVLDRPTTTSIHGADVRRLSELGHSQREIAKKLGLTRHGVAWICGQLGLRMDKAAMRHAVTRSNRRRAGETRAKEAPPNPFLTTAQQENISNNKKRMWGNPTLRAMPPPDADEAARLVAEFIARRGVTVCPPCVIVEPSNAGFKFR